MHLDEAVKEFLMAIMGDVSERTRENYRYGLGPLIDELGADMPVDEITRAHIRRYRHKLAVNPAMAIATRNTHVRACRRLFSWLVAEWEIETSPAAGLRMFDERSEEVKAISMTDYHKMQFVARAAGCWRDVAIMGFLLATGCRVGGLVGLTLDALELPSLRARVVEKGNRARWVFFTEDVANMIRRYNRPQSERPEVFLSLTRHRPLAPNGVFQMLQKHAQAANVTGPHNPHAFRHRFAIAYLENGGDLSSLSALMGHSDIGITHKYYARWDRDTLQAQHAQYAPLHRP